MKISIITTTFNRKGYLEETIESVQKSILVPLTDVEWEHIVYDDGSTDGTEEMFLSKKWNNVFYLKGEGNKGQSFGQNYAISRSTGSYIFLIDSDDVILGRTLYNFIREAKKNPEISWFVSDFIRGDESLRYQVGDDYYAWEFKNPKEMLAAIFSGDHFIQSNVFFKKELFEKVGGFDEKIVMAQDLDLFVRFLLAEKMPGFSPHISHVHRNHSRNLSVGVTLKDHKEIAQELKKKYY